MSSKRVRTWLALCLVLVPALSATSASGSEVVEVDALAGHPEPADAHAAELMRCMRNWEEMRADRVGLPEASATIAGAVLLEIGSSGFPSYGYVRVDGTIMKSSFGPDRDVAATELGRHLVRIYAGEVEVSTPDAGADMDDGQCYFLTMYVRGSASARAYYGTTSSLGGDSVIKQLVETARLP